MAILYNRIEQVMNCPKNVVIWNYFDHEHVVGTHYKHYSKVRVINEMDTWAMSERSRKLPVINWVIKSTDFVFLKDPYTIKARHFGSFGLFMEQDITFEKDEPESCLVINEYKLHVPFFMAFLQPLWRKLTTRWFYVQWNEDLPMRIQRWRVWKLGFRDFYGIDYINKKTKKPDHIPLRPFPIELPVPKATTITTKGFPRLFAKSEEIGYSP